MKTRTLKTTGAMAIFVIVMAAQSVSAYYNPSTGRWLSRDPIAEKGGVNLYYLAHNEPVNHVDPFGLECCKFEVKQAVDNALNAMREWYGKLDERAQRAQCESLHDFVGVALGALGIGGGGGAKAWDLEPIYSWGTDPAFPNYRAAFGGTCYYSSAINYSQWGAMCKLCYTSALKYDWITIISAASFPGDPPNNTIFHLADDFTLEKTKNTVSDWKRWAYNDTGPTATQAISFTEYGYSGTLSDPGVKSSCPVTKTLAAMEWYWSPGKPK